MGKRQSLGVRLICGASTVAASLASCDDSADVASIGNAWRSRVDTIADTIVVHTVDGSLRGELQLQEELRIGVADGEEHELFGEISALAVTAAGDILIYDGQMSALRRFSATGAYLGTIGQKGSGPGEYQDVVGIGVLDDSTVIVNDFGNRRFNVYSTSGALRATWLVRLAAGEMRPLYTFAEGFGTYDERPVGESRTRTDVVLRVNADGEIFGEEPIPNAEYHTPSLQARTARRAAGLKLPFAPTADWTMTSSGEIATMIGERYAIDVHLSDGGVRRMTRQVDAVNVTAAERDVERERVTKFLRRIAPDWNWNGPDIPSVKPPVRWLHAGLDGRLWVRTSQPGTVIPEGQRPRPTQSYVHESLVFDVFESDGRFVGKVRVPDELQLFPHPVFRGDFVWAVVHGADGLNQVVRYRVVSAEYEGR